MLSPKRIITKKNILLIQSGSLLLILYLFTPVKSYATPIALGVYPPLVKIKTTPGSEIKQNIVLSNNSNVPTMVSLEIKQWEPSGKKDGTITYIPTTLAYKNFLSDHFKLLDNNVPINQLLLSPQQKKTLLLDITIPKDISPTEYYLSTLLISKNTDVSKSNASLITGGVATHVLISILNQPQQDFGEITQLIGPTIPNQDPIPFIVTVANQGDNYTTAQGSITITNLLFGTKNTIPFQSEDIAAHTSRYMIDTSGTSLTKILWNHKFLFGIYQVDAAVKLSNNPNVFHRKIYFYSYPAISFGAVLIISIFFGIVIFKIRKNRS